MISKELLSAVLGIPLQHIRYNDTTNLYEIFKENLFNWGDGSYGRWSNLEINVYELADKCKEWSRAKGYRLLSGYLSEKQIAIENNKEPYKELYHCDVHKSNIMFDELYESFSGESEPEAIFQACQWILDKDSK